MSATSVSVTFMSATSVSVTFMSATSVSVTFIETESDPSNPENGSSCICDIRCSDSSVNQNCPVCTEKRTNDIVLAVRLFAEEFPLFPKAIYCRVRP